MLEPNYVKVTSEYFSFLTKPPDRVCSFLCRWSRSSGRRGRGRGRSRDCRTRSGSSQTRESSRTIQGPTPSSKNKLNKSKGDYKNHT